MRWVAAIVGAAVMAVILAVVTLDVVDRDAGSGKAPAASPGPYRGSEPPARLAMPSFALRDYTGELVRSKTMRGKVVLLTFLDSQCTDACPVIPPDRTHDRSAQWPGTPRGGSRGDLHRPRRGHRS